MTLSLTIPIAPNPVLSELDLNNFVTQAHKRGLSPDALLADLIVAAIRKDQSTERADQTSKIAHV